LFIWSGLVANIHGFTYIDVHLTYYEIMSAENRHDQFIYLIKFVEMNVNSILINDFQHLAIETRVSFLTSI
jgi:hypothetical protein